MDPLKFWRQQHELFASGFRSGLASGNKSLALFNVGQALIAAEMSFMINWKMGHPVKEIFDAMMSYPTDAIQIGDPGDLISRFNPFPAFFLSLSYLRNVERKLVEEWLAVSDSADPERQFDAALVESLLEGKRLDLRVPTDSRLWRESMGLYSQLVGLGLQRDEGGFAVAVRKAIELYKCRRRDAFFSGGVAVEGGDDDNQLIFDFRLTAIIACSGLGVSSLPDELAFMRV